MLRLAVARLPIAAASRRYASTSVAEVSSIPRNVEALLNKQLDFKPLNDPRVPHGVNAMVWDVPKDLPENDFIKRRNAVEAHAEGTTDLWRKISFYVCIPAVLVTAIWVYKAEQAHEVHHQALIDANGGVEPERKVYSYMNIRNKPFPWGNDSLFFNPKHNIPVEEA